MTEQRKHIIRVNLSGAKTIDELRQALVILIRQLNAAISNIEVRLEAVE